LWIAREAPLNADRWFNRLIEKTKALEIFPRSHPLAPESKNAGTEVYQLICGNYRILYTIRNDDEVRILHVRHAARRPIINPEL
jgi:plasmid stabilization system protein ParE